MAEPIDIRVEIDDREFQKLLSRMVARGRRLPLKRLATIGVRSVLRNFREEGRPQKWEKRKLRRERRRSKVSGRFIRGRDRQGPILRDTGRLQQSVESVMLNKANFKVRSDLVYAPPHQFGWPERNIPARPFMLWQRADIDDLQKVILDHLERS